MSQLAESEKTSYLSQTPLHLWPAHELAIALARNFFLEKMSPAKAI